MALENARTTARLGFASRRQLRIALPYGGQMAGSGKAQAPLAGDKAAVEVAEVEVAAARVREEQRAGLPRPQFVERLHCDRLLVDAPKLCRRLPATYVWIEAYGLDALCAVAVRHRAEAAPRWIDELEAITARRGMSELLLRATAYRARLGEPGALDAARSMAAQIDNPALGELELEQLTTT